METNEYIELANKLEDKAFDAGNFPKVMAYKWLRLANTEADAVLPIIIAENN